MESLLEKDRETTITILDAVFDLELDDSLFTREKLEQYP
jgi:hypothetical protein